MDLLVNETFYSIQGESSRAGFPSIFIRLCGCNLNCIYCDTEYAKAEGYTKSVEKIIEEMASHKSINHITITGGEPLLQINSIFLMERLIDIGYSVQLETNGSLSVKNVPAGVRKILDVKTPSSGEVTSFMFDNLNYLSKKDEIKFVIADIDDYNFAKDFLKKYLRKKKIIINFSPVLNSMSISELAELILIDRLQVRLNIQLHKIIWPIAEPKHC
ncbi:MAG: radical SAM protein [Spirochaetota bacterium]|nr:radical SAM protein [Spirochaetota bacterium]